MSWQPWNGTIADLAALEESPLSDGMLSEWVETQQVTLSDVPALAALLRSADPHLQEAGVEARDRPVALGASPARSRPRAPRSSRRSPRSSGRNSIRTWSRRSRGSSRNIP